MRFLPSFVTSISLLAGLVASQSSTLFFTSVPHNIQVGQVYSITYKAPRLADPVTIILRQGASGNLQTIGTLTTAAVNGVYAWIPDPTLPPRGDYALEITQGDQVNYSPQFPIAGGNPGYGSSFLPSMPLSTGTAPVPYPTKPVYTGTAPGTAPGTASGTASGTVPGTAPGTASGTGVSTGSGTAPGTAPGTASPIITSAPFGNGTSINPAGSSTIHGGLSTGTGATGGTGGTIHPTGGATKTSHSGSKTLGPVPSGFAAPFQASLGPVAIAMGAVGAVMHML